MGDTAYRGYLLKSDNGNLRSRDSSENDSEEPKIWVRKDSSLDTYAPVFNKKI